MLIKEIIAFGFGVILTLLFISGPVSFQKRLSELKVAILKETTRTDNWGNPGIFRNQKNNAFKSKRLNE
jgi:hypothetical protein